jgi:flagella basal body P-ring formation protein FlgA
MDDIAYTCVDKVGIVLASVSSSSTKSSKKTTPTPTNMQTLCLIKTDTHSSLTNRLWRVLALLIALASGVTSGFAQDQGVKTQIETQLLTWATNQSDFAGKRLRMSSLDGRLSIQQCHQSLQFEQTFPHQPNIKVRCADPQWQLFVTLNEGTGAAELNHAASAPAAELKVVLVSREMIKRGTILSPAMFTLAKANVTGTPDNQLVTDPSSVSNMELLHDLLPNAPLKLYDVKAAVLVKRGQEVVVSTGQGQGFLITLRAEAMQDGCLGEQIHLKNAESGRSLTAVVTGPQEARLK